MSDVWQILQNTTQPIVLYGTGNGADKIIDRLNSLHIPIAGIFASGGFVRNRKFRGIRVCTFEELYAQFPDMIILLCFGSSRPEVFENVQKISSLCPLLVPEVPVYGDTVFDGAFYRQNIDKINRVKQLLNDSESVKTFESVINFRLTGRLSFLTSCQTTEQEIDSLIPDMENAVILDLGAYTGDTALRFCKVFSRITRLIAVEPDKRNFNKLMQNTAHLPFIQYYNAFIGVKPDTAFITPALGRGGHMEQKGKCPVSVLSVDTLLNGSRVDFIKMDVEGAETDAIKGAEKTISAFAPVLMISCYHRSEDIFEIPLQVTELYKGYRVLIRHTPALNSWNTEYLFLP